MVEQSALDALNRKSRFATEGFRIQRHNPDGTKATPQRFLGFANTADLSKVLTTDDTAAMIIKIDNNPASTAVIDFSEVTDKTKVTVQEAVDALTDVFTEVDFSIDARTQRLKGTAANGNIIQVVGKLAAALDFGQGIKHGGNGLEVISFFDDETVSIGLPKDIKDKEEIDTEGAKGTINRMVIPAKFQGKSPVISLKEKDYYLLELIQGGKLNRDTGEYDPPLSDESDSPTFWAEVYSAVYSSGTSKMSDVAGYEKIHLRTMMGKEGDVPIETKSWATYAFNLTATEYVDENKVKYPAWQEGVITIEQFDSLNVKGIKI